MTSNLQSNLSLLLKTRITTEILLPLHTPGHYKILILDPQSFALISTVFASMDELHDLNIPRVVDIAQTRRGNAGMDAIYFVRGTRENIERVIADFAGAVKYRGIGVIS
jgi:hypothetical protein